MVLDQGGKKQGRRKYKMISQILCKESHTRVPQNRSLAKSEFAYVLHYIVYIHILFIWGFPAGSNSKESACNAGDLGLIPRLGRSPGEANGYLQQYSCIQNSMDRGA